MSKYIAIRVGGVVCLKPFRPTNSEAYKALLEKQIHPAAFTIEEGKTIEESEVYLAQKKCDLAEPRYYKKSPMINQATGISNTQHNKALHTEQYIWLFKTKQKRLRMHVIPFGKQMWFEVVGDKIQTEKFDLLADAIIRYNQL